MLKEYHPSRGRCSHAAPFLILRYDIMRSHHIIEKTIAVASFCAAVTLAFVALAIDEHHNIAAGVCMVIAQLLLLTASIFGINYQLQKYGNSKGITK